MSGSSHKNKNIEMMGGGGGGGVLFRYIDHFALDKTITPM